MSIEKEYVDGLLRKIERLQAERDCHHAWQDKACKLLEAAIKQEQVIDTVLECSIDDFLNETPQQCLRDLQADAGLIGFIGGFKRSGEGFNGEYGASEKCIFELASEYAEKVRQGGAE